MVSGKQQNPMGRWTVAIGGAAILALSVVTGLATSAIAQPAQSAALAGGRPTSVPISGQSDTVLYSQNTDAIGKLPSERFEPKYTKYDNRGADDFTVPSGTWTINEIDVTGRYVTKSGPANSENVMFYEDANGSPGTLVTRIRSVGTEDGTGSFTIPLGDSGVSWPPAPTGCLSRSASISTTTARGTGPRRRRMARRRPGATLRRAGVEMPRLHARRHVLPQHSGLRLHVRAAGHVDRLPRRRDPTARADPGALGRRVMRDVGVVLVVAPPKPSSLRPSGARSSHW